MATRTVAESREERKRASEAAKEAMREAASYAATELAAARARCGPDSDLAKRWAMRPCRGRASPSPTAPCTLEGWEQGKSSPPTRRRPLRRTAKANLPRGPLRAQPCPPGF